MLNNITFSNAGRPWVFPPNFNRFFSGNTKKSAPVKKLDKSDLESRVMAGKIPIHKIEKYSQTPIDAVKVRRKYYGKKLNKQKRNHPFNLFKTFFSHFNKSTPSKLMPKRTFYPGYHTKSTNTTRYTAYAAKT